MGRARFLIPKLPGLRFYKLFGTGSGEGFTFIFNPFLNSGVYAILAAWENKDIALQALGSSTIFERYKHYSAENWTVILKPVSVRGLWSGDCPFIAQKEEFEGNIVALTRATIKVSTLLKFWKRVPDIQTVIGADENVLFKIGMGEIPLFHQVTFSIWPSEESMNTFARESGPHARAIRAVRKENWFAEELYARFKIIDQIGRWSEVSPIPSTKKETKPS